MLLLKDRSHVKIAGTVNDGEKNSYIGRSASLGQVDSLTPEF